GFIVNKGGLGKANDKNHMNYGVWMTPSGNIQGGYETSKGSDKFITSSNTYNDGQWHHVVVTYDGSILRLYIDGSEVGSKSIKQSQGPDSTSENSLRIGANSAILDNYFIGNIDEVGVWNGALTQPVILNLIDGMFSETGLIYRNSFDESSTSESTSSSPFILVMPR
ncbi:MAG TPA: LamG domain-containing protein, partial [Nitrososphaeraceae archaeon]|nr:LamG domain-containing protein [Nitrososphaeraceae archaeon]